MYAKYPDIKIVGVRKSFVVLEIFDNICILLAKAEQKHFQYTKEQLNKDGLGITPGQMLVLYTLYKGDGISLTELSKKCYLDNSTLTGLIDRLERLGLVVRADVPEDRRAYNIYLTGEARALREPLAEASKRISTAMLDGCSLEEISAFRKVLLNIFEKL